MPFQILSLNLIATFIIAFDDFVQAPIIMRLKVFVNDHRRASIVLALNSSIVTCYLVRLHFSSLKLDNTALFKQGLTFIWAFYDFKRANIADVILHLTSWNACTAVILALNFKFLAIFSNMFIHIVERKHKTAFKDAVDDPERTFVKLMIV